MQVLPGLSNRGVPCLMLVVCLVGSLVYFAACLMSITPSTSPGSMSAFQLPMRPRPRRLLTSESESGSDLPLEHPRYNRLRAKCFYCQERGHTLQFCPRRQEDNHWLVEEYCTEGYHHPFLHDSLDIWRCRWCLMHLKTSYVKKWYPTVYADERAKAAQRLRRTREIYCD